MKINLGSGYKRHQGYVNVDGDELTSPDYVVDLERDRFPFDDNTVTDVIAHHVLEHIGAGYFHLLQELYRVCKNGAIIDIRVPHPRHETFLNDPTHVRPITVNGLGLLSQKANREDIANGGHFSALGISYKVDFEVVEFMHSPDPYYKDITFGMDEKTKERLFRETNNSLVEIFIKLKVVK